MSKSQKRHNRWEDDFDRPRDTRADKFKVERKRMQSALKSRNLDILMNLKADEYA